MESAPREHEKRTLSAHLECRDVFMCACSYANPCEEQTSSHFVGFKEKRPFWIEWFTENLGHFVMLITNECVNVLSARVRVCLCCILTPNVFVCNGRVLAWDNKERSALNVSSFKVF